MPIASLGMYDQPFASRANDRLWEVIRHALTELSADITPPANLDRITPLSQQWASPDLLLSQTCGYPLITSYREHLQLVTTPVYKHTGCDGAYYSSFILSARGAPDQLEQYRNGRLAANSPTSLSGFVTLEITLHDNKLERPFFSMCHFCGSHAQAVRLVASGQADLCCVDAVSWALLKQHDPDMCNSLQVIQQTTSLPALPLVTARTTPADQVQALRQALHNSLQNDYAQPALTHLGIDGFSYLPLIQYETISARYTAAGTYPIATAFRH